jgi:hypothetical protein
MNALSGLQEYEEVLARTRYPKVAIQRALRTLMQRQFVFGNDFGSKEVYELLNDDQVRPFAERLFDVFGWRLQFNTSGNVKMVCLMPSIAEAPDTPRDKREAHQAPPLRVDEAIAILLLRAFPDNAIQSTGLVNGHAQWYTDGLHDLWKEKTRKDPPGKVRMLDILRFLKNHGLIQASLPPNLHEGMPFIVRPSISLVAVSEPLGALKRYGKRDPNPTSPVTKVPIRKRPTHEQTKTPNTADRSIVPHRLLPDRTGGLSGNTVFLGPNRSGKSSCIDAIQTGLTGGAGDLVVYNAAAVRQNRPDAHRSLQEYCLGVVRHDENEKAKVVRRSSQTWIGLTFRTHDGAWRSLASCTWWRTNIASGPTRAS